MTMAEKQREKDMDALKTDIAALREHIASLAESVKKLVEEKSGGASSAADREDPKGEGSIFGEQWHIGWTDFQQKFEEARNRGEKAVKELAVEIERHPLGSIAAAFGIGFIIAKLLDRGGRE
jgi:ElaB/YqjD/DUF883 family membrane-anchored ribosome-binding protein